MLYATIYSIGWRILFVKRLWQDAREAGGMADYVHLGQRQQYGASRVPSRLVGKIDSEGFPRFRDSSCGRGVQSLRVLARHRQRVSGATCKT